MDTKKVLSYSLLAHIQNSGLLMKDLYDVFIPLVKKSLSMLIQQGLAKDQSISIIQKECNKLFGIDIPIPVLKNILQRISTELNTSDNQKFAIYKDNSFILKDFSFADYDEIITDKKREVQEIENYFQEFCEINQIHYESSDSVFSFIELSKASLGRYISDTAATTYQQDFSAEARFVQYFKNIPKIFEHIKSIYIGSIISSYLDYQPERISTNIELVFDTNFITSLIDLDTAESFDTCRRLIDICKNQGYKLHVLDETIEEARLLIIKIAENYNKSFLVKRVYREGIYNACDRRDLNQADLLRIADNLQDELMHYGVKVVNVKAAIKNKAKFSPENEKLKKIRNNDKAALHDAIALYYVREQRGNKIINRFEDVNCWFVNNSASTSSFTDNRSSIRTTGSQTELIKVDDLINILWLSNPNFSSRLSLNELAEIGLHTLVSLSINDKLPKNSIIRELEKNIQKYAKQRISEKDVIRIAARIAQRNLIDIEDLNKLAEDDQEAFVTRLEEESKIQQVEDEERKAKLESLLNKFQLQTKEMFEAREDLVLQAKNFSEETKKFHTLKRDVEYDATQEIEKYKNIAKQDVEKSKQQVKDIENKYRSEKRERFVEDELKAWRVKSWLELTISVVVYFIVLLFLNGWSIYNLDKLSYSLKNNFAVSSFVLLLNLIFVSLILNNLISKYRNQSNIKAFVERLKIPDDIKPIP